MSNNEIKCCAHDGCLRKLKITDYSCKCKKTFCKYHRRAEKHNCDYDYKDISNSKHKIEDLKCISNKIQKI